MWSQLSSVETKDWWTFRNLLVEKLMYVASEQVHLRKKPANPVPQLAKHHLIYVSQWTERDKELMWPNGLPTHLRGRCTGCNRIVRSVCNCSRTTWLCDRTCFPEHVAKKLFVEHDQWTTFWPKDSLAACKLSSLQRSKFCIRFYHHVTKKWKFMKKISVVNVGSSKLVTPKDLLVEMYHRTHKVRSSTSEY